MKLQRWEGLGSSRVSLEASWEGLRVRDSWEGPKASWEGLGSKQERRALGGLWSQLGVPLRDKGGPIGDNDLWYHQI